MRKNRQFKQRKPKSPSQGLGTDFGSS